MRNRWWTAFLVTLCSAHVCGLSDAQDYLPADLRSSVDQLVRDTAAEPSNRETIEGRTRTLWQWLNAVALTGAFIPVNATQTVASTMAAVEEGAVSLGLMTAVDDLIREFGVRDAMPGAIGPVSVSPEGPFEAESWQTISVTYTLGDLAMQEGAVVVLGRHFLSDTGRWQRDNPDEDNYISVRASKPGIAFSAQRVPVRGMHGGFRGPQPQLAFKMEGGGLESGDTFTVTYGDTSGGSRGFQMQSFSNDASPLPIYVDFERSGTLFSLPIATYETTGGVFHAVHGFVPSVVSVGEAFDVSVRAEDVNYNRATGPVPAMRVSLNGEPFRELPPSDGAIQILSGISFDDPGVYRFGFEDLQGRHLGASDPVWVREDAVERIYWGETHGHCGFAEGQGTPDSYFTFGRDDARLDFLTLSEHDLWMDDYEWKVLNDAVRKYSKEDRFIVYPGYEWTSRRNRGGHHNVFFRRAGFDRVPVQEAPFLNALYLALNTKYDPNDVLIIPHAHQAGDWRMTDVRTERLVEIMSTHGTFEWFGNRYLEFGREVGFISASDDHLSHPGYTSGSGSAVKQRGGLAAVFTTALTTDAVFDALRNRQTYATSGARMILDATLNGERMGLRQDDAEERNVEGRVFGTAAIDAIELVKNGEMIERIDYLGAESGDRSRVQVNFSSDSIVPNRDNPRGYRPWRGTLEVSGATIDDVATPGFQDARSEWARRDEDHPNRIEFQTATRGRANNMLLQLSGVTDDTTVRITLKQTREVGTAPIQVREPARIPSADVTFKIGDAEDGRLAEAFQVGRYRDELSLRFVNPDAPLDQSFSFTDTEDPQPGDYYYVRVMQLDGAQAWSSAFWVGGESPR